MHSSSKTDIKDVQKCFMNIDFGVVPVGSVHKKSIDITNNLKKKTTFKVKNDNEFMYLADSISFKPLETPRIFPNKKATFSIIFSPKYVQTTLEYFTIFSVDDEIETFEMKDNESIDENNYEESLNGGIVQKVTICVQGSCYGPSVKIFPVEVFIDQSGVEKQVLKSVNLINSSKIPAEYHVQYDWANSPLKCHPSSGVIEKRIQIKLELRPRSIGYYYRRLYVMIANHHPVYIDVYAFSSMVTTVDPFSYFRKPFEQPPKSENMYIDFFNDITKPSQQHVVVFPKELNFGYAKKEKSLSFDVYNNSSTPLFINWINSKEHCSNNSFAINPKRFYIDAWETKTVECLFRPKTISNIYFAELEATVHFGPGQGSPLGDYATSNFLPPYIIPMNISITVTGHSFEKTFKGWKPKCKLSTRVIIMPPSVPASKSVFATFLIKKVVQVPTTFEFRPPNSSLFLVKPKCGMINGDYQIVVFQLLKTSKKESLYAERWNLIFDGIEKNSVNVDIYACVEFGCIAIGEKNRVFLPNNVQVGYEINTQIPIVNKTRHRLRYYINTYEQIPKSKIKSDSSPSSIWSGYEELDTEDVEDIDYEHLCDELSQKYKTTDTSINELEYNKCSSTLCTDYSAVTSIESSQSLDVLKNYNSEKLSVLNQSSRFVFKFDELTGELGPNEKRYLKLSFCPLKSVSYMMKAKCYLMCIDFPEIVNVLPVVVKGKGCKTQLEIKPSNCNLNETIVSMERTQQFIIENKSCSYANIKFVKVPVYSMIYWTIPTCKINPETFHFTPQKNQCKMDLSIKPSELGYQKFFVSIQLMSKLELSMENENIITVSMYVITSALKISRIINDSVPYFGKLALNKLFHSVKVNNELSKVYTEKKPPLIWIVPVISESTIYEFQLHNLPRIPINWALKYNKCINCSSENNHSAKNSNKCVHYKSIRISPTVNLKMEDFSKIKIEFNDFNTNAVKLSYNWSSGIHNRLLYNAELLLEPKVLNDHLISFDPKYGTDDCLEFNFLPVFIAHPNPPAQAFWMFNSSNCNVEYSIVGDSLKPENPYFHCLNPSGTVGPRSVHPLLYVFAPDKLCEFETSNTLLSNNNRRQVNLLGQGESYTRTTFSPGPGLSSFLPKHNDRKIFLSTESIILQPICTCSNVKSMFCLYNNSDEEIMYEWKQCTVEKILSATVMPFKGNLKRHEVQVFEITVSSYNQPAILTIMFNISYEFVSQNENYKKSLKDYNVNKNKLAGIFLINECGNFKPKLKMKLENKPQEKHLVLYVHVRIYDEYNCKWMKEAKHNIKKYICQQKKYRKQKIQCSENFRNILWTVIDNVCSKRIEWKSLYYYKLRNSKQPIQKEISMRSKQNSEIILTALIRDSLIDIYPEDTWKNV